MGAIMGDLEQHWAETRSLTTWILIVWFIFSMGIVFFRGFPKLNDILWMAHRLLYGRTGFSCHLCCPDCGVKHQVGEDWWKIWCSRRRI